jgi:hypothetical protein
MTSRERLVAALDRKTPDRLPVTTHHVMGYFLDHYLDGASIDAFFDRFGLDPVRWVWPAPPPATDTWRIETESVPGQTLPTTRHRVVTPKGELTALTQSNDQTTWVVEHLVKERTDIDLIGEFSPPFVCDAEQVRREAADVGDRGIVRGLVPCFEVFGQPGCWQDASCLYGIQELIMAACEDPAWVHEFLAILQRRKLAFVRSLDGLPFDVLELGGGDASSTVISPAFFDAFVAPYDEPLIAAAHEAGQRIAYHTCGGMMPILENIAAMNPDAMETFTPPAMGGDTDLAEAKRRVGGQVCMIGGFDQFHFFSGCTPEATRAEVRRCFEAAGAGGGFILSPSDHFFDAEPALIAAFADEARACAYGAPAAV